MTREQLDAIRARVDELNATNSHEPAAWEENRLSMADTKALLAEVERLRDAHAMAVQVSGELCEKCGWAMKFPEEPCRCELLDGTERQALLSEIGRLKAEVERLTADPLPAAAWVREVQQAAFARGVAAMREAAAQRCEVSPIHGEKTTTARKYADAVRALPDPEDTK